MPYRRRRQQQPWSRGARPSPITTTITPSPSFYSLDDDVVVKEMDSSYEDVDLVIGSNKANENDSLAAKAIRASSAAHTHRDSSLSSAYAVTHPSPTSSSFSSSYISSSNPTSTTTSQPKGYAYTSMKTQLNEESKQGFWGSLARKAKSILDDDNYSNAPPSPQQQQQQQQKQQLGDLDSHGNWTTRHCVTDTATKPKNQNAYPTRDTYRKTEPPALQKGLNAISSSLNYIGNAVEEGLTIVENRTADIIQETRNHMRKKPNAAAGQNQATNRSSMWQQLQMQTSRQPPQKETDQELQLKASRDVAMAMAAKAKLLLRELKTVKADLAFAKERCVQLEEENKILRENCERGENLEDDDLIRLQLETLLAEKARLAHENSVYARENRFLREVVEYHQLTMQDVVYLDEGTEDVTEVYPIKVISNNPSIPGTSPPTEASFGTSLPVAQDILPQPVPPPGSVDISQSAASPSSYTTSSSIAVDMRKHPDPSV